MPQNDDPRLTLLETVRRNAAVTLEALFGGQTPLEQGGGELLGSLVDFHDTVRGFFPQGVVDAAERVGELGVSPEAGALGMLFPGVPGGPVFGTFRDLETGLRRMPTEQLIEFGQDASRTTGAFRHATRNRFPGRHPDDIPIMRSVHEAEAANLLVDKEIVRRALRSPQDDLAQQFASFVLDEFIVHPTPPAQMARVRAFMKDMDDWIEGTRALTQVLPLP